MGFCHYVVQVISGQEKKVKKAIEDSRHQKGGDIWIKNVLLPIEHVAEVKMGQQKVVERKVWPGYLIVEMDLNDESWQYINDCDGVIGFLGGEKPLPLSQEEVHSILADLENKQGGVVHRHDIQIGDRVKIVDGVFETFTGHVVEANPEKGKLKVLVAIFGRETREEMEFWQVEKILPEQELD